MVLEKVDKKLQSALAESISSLTAQLARLKSQKGQVEEEIALAREDLELKQEIEVLSLKFGHLQTPTGLWWCPAVHDCQTEQI